MALRETGASREVRDSRDRKAGAGRSRSPGRAIGCVPAAQRESPTHTATIPIPEAGVRSRFIKEQTEACSGASGLGAARLQALPSTPVPARLAVYLLQGVSGPGLQTRLPPAGEDFVLGRTLAHIWARSIREESDPLHRPELSHSPD